MEIDRGLLCWVKDSLITMDSSDTEDDKRIEMGSRPSNISNQSFRNRLFGMVNVSPRARDKPICTTPGQLCAGETETETDEPVGSIFTFTNMTTHLSSSSLVATSSNISNHSGVRPSRTPQPTTKTVNPSSFRILSSSLNSSCHIWHALQFIPPVPTSNL